MKREVKHPTIAAAGLLLFMILVFSQPARFQGQEIKPSSAENTSRDSRYPAHWWAAAPKEGAPSWEILPQEAGPGEVILSKRNELGLLSNFAATPFVYEGKLYSSLEGFWQMMKYPEGLSDARAKFPGLEWKFTREEVARLISFEAKNAGTLADVNMKKMGITWVTFAGKQFEYNPETPGEQYRLIVAATWEKVRQNSEVKKVLLSTGDLILKPDHHQGPNPPAAWRYYEILTQIRTELQKQDQQTAATPPLLTFDDLQKNDQIEGSFRIDGYVIDFFKCPPCPPRAMCKPCIGDNIVVTDNITEKDPKLIRRLKIFTDKPGQFELKKSYQFTVKVRGRTGQGKLIVELVSFTMIPG